MGRITDYTAIKRQSSILPKLSTLEVPTSKCLTSTLVITKTKWLALTSHPSWYDRELHPSKIKRKQSWKFSARWNTASLQQHWCWCTQQVSWALGGEVRSNNLAYEITISDGLQRFLLRLRWKYHVWVYSEDDKNKFESNCCSYWNTNFRDGGEGVGWNQLLATHLVLQKEYIYKFTDKNFWATLCFNVHGFLSVYNGKKNITYKNPRVTKWTPYKFMVF